MLKTFVRQDVIEALKEKCPDIFSIQLYVFEEKNIINQKGLSHGEHRLVEVDALFIKKLKEKK